MALHISTKDDIATTQAVTARIAAGQMAADLPKADHVARTPVPPFLAEKPADAPQADSSPIHVPDAVSVAVFGFLARWWLDHPDLHQVAVCGEPPAPTNEVLEAAWVRYLLATATTRGLAEDKTHWHKMKLSEARWHAAWGSIPPEIPKRETKPIKPRKRHQQTVEAIAA
jgi:hypothetical protein